MQDRTETLVSVTPHGGRILPDQTIKDTKLLINV